jgi:crotonobetainyl-CoA:carnitine CoA-transferase CaiB-like acyl-CoA transferase
MILADLGADVVKVEPPAGDFTRSAGPNLGPDDAYGGYFQSVNRNKKSIAIDLKAPAGRAVFLRLAAGSDVLLENFRAGVMDKLDLSYEQLARINGRLVYGSIRGFGDPRAGRSPYSDWPAYDVIAQAMGGLLGITGPPDSTPVKAGVGIGDIFPAVLLSTGVLAALYDARATGRGRYVDVAMYDAVLALCERLVYQYSFTGEVPVREGNGHPFFAPFGVFDAKDGQIAIAAPGQEHWERLVAAIGHHDAPADPDLATAARRSANRIKTNRTVQDWVSGRTVEQVVAAAGGDVPIGPVQTIAQIAADPHVAARSMIRTVPHPPCDAPVQVAGQPIRFAGAPDVDMKRAPLLGEHTHDVLADLGLSAGEIDDLLRTGAVS